MIFDQKDGTVKGQVGRSTVRIARSGKNPGFTSIISQAVTRALTILVPRIYKALSTDNRTFRAARRDGNRYTLCLYTYSNGTRGWQREKTQVDSR